MSAAHFMKGVATLCAIALSLAASSPARAQANQQRLPTIADCPRGYVLAVQDTDGLMPLAKAAPAPVDPNAYSVNGAMAAYQADQIPDAAYAAAQAAAPRAFVTGCVLPQQLQQR